ncbi:MAG: B12-binding domain-containing protein [Phycisphaeraceae bacterium]|nr:B12-binding domain-containing protein [Phycisphaeraceae bacterium]
MRTTLTTTKLARAIGVSESSLKRWSDDGRLNVARTAGGHRRITLVEAVRFIRAIGASVVRPELLGLNDLEGLPLDWAVTADPLQRVHKALEDGDGPAFRATLQSLYLQGWTVPEICDGPIRAALESIGTMWLHAEWGIAVEHRATDLCIQALSQLRPLIAFSRPDAPVALGSAGPADPYMLPSLMASVTLWEVGFRDVNLGPDTPISVLRNAARQYRPALIWVSISVAAKVREVLDDVRRLADEAREFGGTVVVGGRAVAASPPSAVEGLAHATSMGELAAFARAVLRPQPRPGR